jgi:hypothetical protein
MFIRLFFAFFIPQTRMQTLKIKQEVIERRNPPNSPTLFNNTIIHLKYLFQTLLEGARTRKDKQNIKLFTKM